MNVLKGQDCALPLKPGPYSPGNLPMLLTWPEIPKLLEPYLIGTYEVKTIGIDPSGNEVACSKIVFKLV